MYDQVIVDIVEQPAEINERFRYKCEGKSVVIGANSTPNKRTYPAIRLLNYTGSAVVVVSCVTAEKPYKQHPNNLVGKTPCKGGVRTVDFETDASKPTVISFKSIGIQCCKKSDIETVLAEREHLQIDPFKAKFAHKDEKLDLTTVRLCFQVLLKVKSEPDGRKLKFHPIPPIVSNIIRDKKFVTEFKIRYISDITSPAIGGKEIVVICDKFSRDDIKVRFFRESANGLVSWEAWGIFGKRDVYHSVAIVFKTPPYEIVDIEEPVSVVMQIVRVSDNWHSEPRCFQYIPNNTNVNRSIKKTKRKFIESGPIDDYVHRWDEDQRNRRKMEITLNITGTPAPQSNFSVDGAYGNNLPQSNLIEQPHVHDQRLQQCFHPENYDYYSQHQLQSNFPESHSNRHQTPRNILQSRNSYQQQQQQQPSSSHLSQSQNNQILHGHIQHHQYPQYQSNYDYQSLNHLPQPQRFRGDQALNIPIELKHEPQFNVDCVTREPNQQQYSFPSNFHEVSTPTTYNPLTNHQNSNQCNSMAQGLNNFVSSNNTTSVHLHQQEQLVLCDSNFDAQENVDNMSGSFSSLAIETL